MSKSGGSSKAKTDPLVKEQRKIAGKQWKRYKKDFAPVEKKFIKGLEAVGSEDERQFLKGMAENRLRQSVGPAPSTGNTSQILNRSLAMGGSKLSEANRLESRARKWKGLDTAISLGRNIGTGALNRISRQAQINTSANIGDAEAEGIRRAGMYDAAGTIGGYYAYKGLKEPDAGGTS